MKLPVPSTRTISVAAWSAVTVTVAVVAFLMFVGLSSIQQAQRDAAALDRKDRDFAILIQDGRAERRAAARERRVIAANQDALLDYTRSLAQRQSALLTYLHKHGIDIPTRFVAPVDSPALRDPTPPSGDIGRDRHRDHNPPQPRDPPKGDGDNGNPPGQPNGPGNSDNAPGHNKPPKHHKHGKH